MTGMDANPVPGSPVSEVRFTAERVLLTLQDGRTLAAPPSWVGPRVLELSDADRAAWTPTPDGRGVNWPAAGQDSADGALNVWTLEEDALYSAALDRLSAADWDATALDARREGLTTTVLADLCAGVAEETTEAALTEMRAAGVAIR